MSATNCTPTLTNATVTPEGRRALWGAAIGYAMDGFDLLILGFMLRQIGHDLNLNAAQAASLVTATLIGAVVGGHRRVPRGAVTAKGARPKHARLDTGCRGVCACSRTTASMP